MSAGMRNPH